MCFVYRGVRMLMMAGMRGEATVRSAATILFMHTTTASMQSAKVSNAVATRDSNGSS